MMGVMSEVTCDVTVSLDGFVAGPRQGLEHPLGEGGEQLHRWMFEPTAAAANAEEVAAIVEAGAFVMGRNMFGPDRGEWDLSWRGWWGDEPPYHAPVFVVTHHAREPVPMAGGTTFHFVTEGPAEALTLARDAAGSRNVAVAGGASVIDQLLAIGAIDVLRLHVAPITLGDGERLFDSVGELSLEPVTARPSTDVTHLTYRARR